jgi:single-stranded DNA-binding protein
MNRVVLCGRLVARPRLWGTAAGLTVASLCLHVPRQGLAEPPKAMDEIDCLAFEALAQKLHQAAEPGVRVHLERWLLLAPPGDREGPSPSVYRVAVEAAYWIDPRSTAPVPVPIAPSPAQGRQGSPPSECPVAAGNGQFQWLRDGLVRLTGCLIGTRCRPLTHQRTGA